jgi:hypothetical protein
MNTWTLHITECLKSFFNTNLCLQATPEGSSYIYEPYCINFRMDTWPVTQGKAWQHTRTWQVTEKCELSANEGGVYQ